MEPSREQLGCLHVQNKVHPIYRGLNRIGRDPDATVILVYPSVSQNQAIITVINENLHYISEVKSTNGTFLKNDNENIKLKPLLLYELQDDAKIQFAKISAVYKRSVPSTSKETLNSQINASVFLGSTQLIEDTFSQNEVSIATSNGNQNNLGVIPEEVSIHDMSTQISEYEPKDADTSLFKLPSVVKHKNTNEMTQDIHDMDTQIMNSEIEDDIHDMSTQIMDAGNNSQDDEIEEYGKAQELITKTDVRDSAENAQKDDDSQVEIYSQRTLQRVTSAWHDYGHPIENSQQMKEKANFAGIEEIPGSRKLPDNENSVERTSVQTIDFQDEVDGPRSLAKDGVSNDIENDQIEIDIHNAPTQFVNAEKEEQNTKDKNIQNYKNKINPRQSKAGTSAKEEEEERRIAQNIFSDMDSRADQTDFVEDSFVNGDNNDKNFSNESFDLLAGHTASLEDDSQSKLHMSQVTRKARNILESSDEDGTCEQESQLIRKTKVRPISETQLSEDIVGSPVFIKKKKTVQPLPETQDETNCPSTSKFTDQIEDSGSETEIEDAVEDNDTKASRIENCSSPESNKDLQNNYDLDESDVIADTQEVFPQYFAAKSHPPQNTSGSGSPQSLTTSDELLYKHVSTILDENTLEETFKLQLSEVGNQSQIFSESLETSSKTNKIDEASSSVTDSISKSNTAPLGNETSEKMAQQKVDTELDIKRTCSENVLNECKNDNEKDDDIHSDRTTPDLDIQENLDQVDNELNIKTTCSKNLSSEVLKDKENVNDVDSDRTTPDLDIQEELKKVDRDLEAEEACSKTVSNELLKDKAEENDSDRTTPDLDIQEELQKLDEQENPEKESGFELNESQDLYLGPTQKFCESSRQEDFVEDIYLQPTQKILDVDSFKEHEENVNIEEDDVFLAPTQQINDANFSDSLNTSKKSDEDNSFSISPTQKLANIFAESDNIFMQPTQHVFSTPIIKQSITKRRNKVSFNINPGSSKCDEEIFIVATQKLEETISTDIFAEATQKLSPIRIPQDVDLFDQPTPVLNKQNNKVAKGAVTHKPEGQGSCKMSAEKVVDNESIFVQATQPLKISTETLNKNGSQEVESQLEVMFSSQTPKVNPDYINRPPNPLVEVFDNPKKISTIITSTPAVTNKNNKEVKISTQTETIELISEYINNSSKQDQDTALAAVKTESNMGNMSSKLSENSQTDRSDILNELQSPISKTSIHSTPILEKDKVLTSKNKRKRGILKNIAENDVEEETDRNLTEIQTGTVDDPEISKQRTSNEQSTADNLPQDEKSNNDNVIDKPNKSTRETVEEAKPAPSTRTTRGHNLKTKATNEIEAGSKSTRTRNKNNANKETTANKTEVETSKDLPTETAKQGRPTRGRRGTVTQDKIDPVPVKRSRKHSNTTESTISEENNITGLSENKIDTDDISLNVANKVKTNKSEIAGSSDESEDDFEPKKGKAKKTTGSHKLPAKLSKRIKSNSSEVLPSTSKTVSHKGKMTKITNVENNSDEHVEELNVKTENKETTKRSSRSQSKRQLSAATSQSSEGGNNQATTKNKGAKKQKIEKLNVIRENESDSSESNFENIRSSKRNKRAAEKIDGTPKKKKNVVHVTGDAPEVEDNNQASTSSTLVNKDNLTLETPSNKITIFNNTSNLSTPERLKRTLKPKVVFTMLDDPELQAIIKSLGGSIVDNVAKSTVLVTGSVKRSQKLLAAVGEGKPICSPLWLSESKTANTFLDPWDFILEDAEAETKWNFSLKEALSRSQKNRLLSGYCVQIVLSTAVDVLKVAIEACGGKVVSRAPAKSTNTKFFAVGSQTEKTKYTKFLKMKPPVMVVASEAIFDAVLRQELHLQDHVLH